MTTKDEKALQEAEQLRNSILSRLREVESKLKSVQEKLAGKEIPDLKETEDLLNFKDTIFYTGKN
jgi:hypothetical protein